MSTNSVKTCGEIEIRLSGIKLGVVEAADLRVINTDIGGLSDEIDAACSRLLRLNSLTNFCKWESILAVRQMFRHWGIDPSKHRPSAEALLRRMIKGEHFPRISNVVDVGNLGAIETGWPFGCYNRAKISGSVVIRPGKCGEEYEGIGRGLLRLEGRPVFSDTYGPFGSPISDSHRTMVNESTNELLMIICVPFNTGGAVLEDALGRLINRLIVWCGASGIEARIVAPTLASYISPSEATMLP